MPDLSRPIPLLIMSDAVSARTGLARVSRELCWQIHDNLSDTFRVGSYGLGEGYSSHFPWPNYECRQIQEWATLDLPRVWKDFAGDQRGILLCIWNISWLSWLADPSMLRPEHRELRSFLESRPFEKWIYAPVDSDGPGGRLGRTIAETLAGFDRVLAYTEYGSRVIDASLRHLAGSRHSWIPNPHDPTHLDNQCTTCGAIDCSSAGEFPCPKPKYYDHVTPWLPHGIHRSIFYPRDRQQARNEFIGRVTGLKSDRSWPLSDNTLLIGVVATNSARKDWPLAYETCSILKQHGYKVMLWAHTDYPQKYWDLISLAEEFSMDQGSIISTHNLSDDDMAWAYSACTATLVIGHEGWGIPGSESLACQVPVITGSYAGCTQYVPRKHLIDPIAWQWDGFYCHRRPVFDASHWADAVECCWLDAEYRNVKLDDRYYWDVCFPEWHQWLVDGVSK